MGSALIRQLLERGEELKALVRPDSNLRRIHGLNMQVVQGDIRDADMLRSALKGCERVYHAAALYTLNDPPRWYDEINVEGTANVIRAAGEAGVRRVVYTSTVGAVGSAPDGGLADEETEWNLGDLDIPYILTKRQAEEVAYEQATDELELVVVNPAGPIGAGDVKPTPTGRLVLDFLNGRLPLVPVAENNFVDVDDVALGHILAMEKGKPGERYILGSENMTTKGLLDLVAGLTGQRRPWALPYGVAWVGGLLAEIVVQWIFRRRSLANRATVRFLKRRMTFSVDKARNELGLNPVPVRQAAVKAIRWFCENGYVKKRRRDRFLKRLDQSE